MVRTCAHTNTRSSTRVVSLWPNSPDSAFEAGEADFGQSRIPSPIRAACHSSSVSAIVAMSARIRSASPRWLPSNRRGRRTLRMYRAAATPIRTSTANRSTRNAYQPWWPSHGSVACLSTMAMIAMRIVGSRTMKPQKMNACISPGPSRWSSLRWPSTIVASFLTRRRALNVRSVGCAPRTRPVRNSTRRRNSVPLTMIAAASATAAGIDAISPPPSRSQEPRSRP
jgi:hypothetical protein